jgi:putative acetyltransferase
MRIAQALTDQDVVTARLLFQEYAAGLDTDLCFQGFATEVSSLPGAYSPPQGRLLLAWSDPEPAGCVALRPMSEGICEMKRLFVRPAFRGQGLGRKLTEQALEEARDIGYSTMRLDTLPSMWSALRLYQLLGFARCDAYYDTPLRGTIFMELKL